MKTAERTMARQLVLDDASLPAPGRAPGEAGRPPSSRYPTGGAGKEVGRQTDAAHSGTPSGGEKDEPHPNLDVGRRKLEELEREDPVGLLPFLRRAKAGGWKVPDWVS